MERLHLLDLPSLELRRLHIDLICSYKIIFGFVHINFRFNKNTRGHCYKLYKQTNQTNTRFLFGQRILNVWNSLPDCVDFRSLTSFKITIVLVNFNQFL